MMMMKYLLTVLVVAMLAITAAVAVTAADPVHAAPHSAGERGGEPPLAKTWTTGVHEKEPCSQVLVTASLANHGSFLAEGKGFEPSTGRQAPDFESLRHGLSPAQSVGRCQAVPPSRSMPPIVLGMADSAVRVVWRERRATDNCRDSLVGNPRSDSTIAGRWSA